MLYLVKSTHVVLGAHMKSIPKLAVLISVIGTFSSLPAVAQTSFGTCVSPGTMTIPVSLGSELAANQWLITVETAQLEYGDYLRCLHDYWIQEEQKLTDREREALIEEMRASIGALKRLASDWNDVYGKFEGERIKK